MRAPHIHGTWAKIFRLIMGASKNLTEFLEVPLYCQHLCLFPYVKFHSIMYKSYVH